MKFRTEYKAEKSDIILSPAVPVAFVGSCFSENIAGIMRASLWDARNPLGTLYNPLSIANVLELSLLSLFPEREYEKTLFLKDDKYYSRLFDSRFSAYLAADCMAAFTSRRNSLWEVMAAGSVLIVTFGTAWVYELKEQQGYVVGNCHKLPAEKFDRRRLSVMEIVERWDSLLVALKRKFPQLKVIFTVSPVRHLKDGFEGNSLSKSILRIAIDEICGKHSYCCYFPAFEIVTDDLRDYRFYGEDLVHPSSMAVDYVWEKFKETFLDKDALELLSECEKIAKRISHRPLPDSSILIPEEIKAKEMISHKNILDSYNTLKERYPAILDM